MTYEQVDLDDSIYRMGTASMNFISQGIRDGTLSEGGGETDWVLYMFDIWTYDFFFFSSNFIFIWMLEVWTLDITAFVLVLFAFHVWIPFTSTFLSLVLLYNIVLVIVIMFFNCFALSFPKNAFR